MARFGHDSDSQVITRKESREDRLVVEIIDRLSSALLVSAQLVQHPRCNQLVEPHYVFKGRIVTRVVVCFHEAEAKAKYQVTKTDAEHRENVGQAWH